ncbi:outer membrane protein assembly factor BamC [Methylicorpusculum sp.]|uniref:outer membrane protein assembly factor BamC n=1 Tax=Methylicorpusculum sp. TaxID=2713644 RepID=UPI0027235491|nr:outer membrane protein assembly factor BamC [Methylicorpusculum sp.]MDO8845002.1 outer membrane protein assembly factor BamC [Methylicorpusculum sp.]
MMNRSIQKIVYCVFAGFHAAALISCAEPESKYRNTEILERPPELTVVKPEHPVEKIDPVATSASIKKGLGDKVKLETSGLASTLVINESFDQSWFILGLVLNQQEIEITDKNRDEGYIYVSYDPDNPNQKGFLSGFLSADNYEERIYSLQLREAGQLTEITAKIVEDKDSEKTFGKPDDKPDRDDELKDGPDRLLETLFKVLRDGVYEEVDGKDGTLSVPGLFN